MTVINSFSGRHSYLDNFYPSPVSYEGQEYRTVEHAFQAAKTIDPVQREAIRTAATAANAKHLGQQCTMTPDWESTRRYIVMRQLVEQKFRRYDALGTQLVNTGDTILIEGNTWNDTIWGECDGVGENHLGLILMQVRTVLQAEIFNLKYFTPVDGVDALTKQ